MSKSKEKTTDSVSSMLSLLGGKAKVLADEDLVCDVPYTCSSGSMVLDSVILNGDDPTSEWNSGALVPFGRWVTITGLPKLGKTSLAAAAARSVQSYTHNGHRGIVGVLDTEQALSKDWWRLNGVDLDRVITLELKGKDNTIANVARGVWNLIESRNEVSKDIPLLIIWDSVGMTNSETQLTNLYDKKIGEESKGSYGKAKEIGDYIIPLKDALAEHNVCLYAINHLYEDVGSHIKSYKAGGGKKLGHVESYHLRLNKPKQKTALTRTVDGVKRQYGQQSMVTTVFNKLHPPHAVNNISIVYDEGVSDHHAVYDACKDKKWTPSGGTEIKFRNYGEFRKKVVHHPQYLELFNQVRWDVYRLPAVDALPYLPSAEMTKELDPLENVEDA